MQPLKNLKKLFIALSFVAGLTACNNKSSDKRDIHLLNDSTAYHNSSSTDTATRTKVNEIRNNTSNNKKASAVGTDNSGASGNESTVSKNEASSSTKATQKKGWSKGAQGAVIGGAVGAVGGAIISKKKGVGAAVGGAVGAAGGYIIGHEKDKKDGRVKK
ncbi:MAG TPA: glycine zipper domain-containing protein [Hanamia sp.]|nr:glycine zipper domain-containing protein [Hanamia sp.]